MLSRPSSALRPDSRPHSPDALSIAPKNDDESEPPPYLFLPRGELPPDARLSALKLAKIGLLLRQQNEPDALAHVQKSLHLNPMAGVIASVEERIRGKIKLQDGSSFQNPPPPRPTRKDDATTLRREAEEQKWTTSRNGRENSTLASRSAAAAWM